MPTNDDLPLVPFLVFLLWVDYSRKDPTVLRTLVVGVAACVATLGFVGVARAATGYVALGDSYSSGVGAGSYLDSSSCKRSAKAYPYLYANSSGDSLSFEACSGAKTSDVINSQVSALDSATGLVSITIGGNDAGFSSVMENCVLGGDSGCHRAVSNAENFVQTTLPGLLDDVFSTIKSKAPNARVVVLGYPHFYMPWSPLPAVLRVWRVPKDTSVRTQDARLSAETCCTSALRAAVPSACAAAGRAAGHSAAQSNSFRIRGGLASCHGPR